MSSSNGSAALDWSVESTGRVGLGYGIAVAAGILVLVCTILLASYLCLRLRIRWMEAQAQAQAAAAPSNSIIPLAPLGATPPVDWLVIPAGIDQATLEKYPKIVFSAQQPLPRAETTACSICLADFRDEEVLRMMPECLHVFHVQCIDSWLHLQASCPVCRYSPLLSPRNTPTPVGTPESELAPLAARRAPPLNRNAHIPSFGFHSPLRFV